MASKRIIEVRISGSIENKTTKEKQAEPKNDVKEEDKAPTIFSNVLATQVFSQVKEIIADTALYGINRHLALTDDYIGERQLNAGLTVINRTISSASIVAFGSSLGPVGIALGVAVAASSLIFDVVKNYDQQNILIRQMDKQLEFQRQRVGYSLTSGSIGENR